MDLAKDRADVGLFTNRYDEMRDFYGGQLGLTFLETAGIGKVQQHRYDLGGSWLKINAASNPLPPRSPGGYQKLVIPTAKVTEPKTLTDPDGNTVELVPPGYNGIDHVELHLGVSDVGAFERFHSEVLGSTRIGPARFRLGRSDPQLWHRSGRYPLCGPAAQGGRDTQFAARYRGAGGTGMEVFHRAGPRLRSGT